MNYSIIRRTTGLVLKFEAVFLLIPAVTGFLYREQAGFIYLALAAIYFALGFLINLKSDSGTEFFTKEGFISVALVWIVISICGALPFVLTGDIPSYSDALFETISGFTTTGSSILSDVEALSHASLIWRSFTHWVGGMGVIVFVLAIMPMRRRRMGSQMHMMRAESPGPVVGKLVPKLRDTAMILYKIYFGITVAEIILLLIAGMPLFDTLCLSFGTAGTGGFGVLGDSIASYPIPQQAIITVFMILFGVNFSAYFILFLGKDKKEAFRLSEIRWYFGIIAFAIITITINIRGMFDNLFLAFHHAAFQVGSIITTTGYATADFDLWPQYSRLLLVMIMFVGACAGSTGGGIKVSRIVILVKAGLQEIHHYVHPRSVTAVRMDGKPVERETVRGVVMYVGIYVVLFSASVLLVTVFDGGETLETIFTAVAATFNNIGPGLSAVGATANFGHLSLPSKYVLMFDMLAGRLELYPMLLLIYSIFQRDR
ncbi:MAG: TrkH family potassium uptake protein [Eubacteriales bacterium]|nr:TrkH family potassium uptake protein [Sarcina sp.]MBR2729241.1 TrkH family potassium uptake protein [Lachnospiraceae bacterium]MDO4417003.1 TrkH family potassium uptake protein [Eubacteriales bacterium]